MSYTSVIYKNNNKVYIGIVDKEDGLEVIKNFKPLPYYRNMKTEDDVMYVVMVDDNYCLYELDKIRFDKLSDEKTTISSLEPDEVISISSRILQKFHQSTKIH